MLDAENLTQLDLAFNLEESMSVLYYGQVQHNLFTTVTFETE